MEFSLSRWERKEDVAVRAGGGEEEVVIRERVTFALVFYHVRPLPLYSVTYTRAETLHCHLSVVRKG